MKRIIISIYIFHILCVPCIKAQDIILKTNGEELQVKVTEVNTDDVRYKKFSNLSGPVYVIQNADIFMIKYENGNKDLFEKNTQTGKISIRQIVNPNSVQAKSPTQTQAQAQEKTNVSVSQEPKPAPIASTEPTEAKDQFLLGQKYEKGDGVTQDNQKAADWYSKAAEQGYADAQYRLGILCSTVKTLRITTKEDFQMRNGTFVNTAGLTVGPATALFWWKKAADQGHIGAKAKIQEMEAANKPAAQTTSTTPASKSDTKSTPENGTVNAPVSKTFDNGSRQVSGIDNCNVKAENPIEVFKMFLNSVFKDGNYLSLCDSQIDELQLQKALAKLKKHGEKQFIITPKPQDIDSFYSERTREDIPLPKDHYVFGVISIDDYDRKNPIKDYHIYGVVRHDVKKDTYCITVFEIGKNYANE